eukprot:6057610-Karenia_brevis.AAC.1
MQSNSEEKIAKRVRFMQEREYTEEDKAMQRDIFGEELHDSKRKEEVAQEESPDTKRRRTQEDED